MNKPLLNALLLSFIALFSATSYAEITRVELLRVDLGGVYWDKWTGLPVVDKVRGKVDVHIKGEGKTAVFEGIVTIFCTNGGGFDWKTATFWGDPATEGDLKAKVPKKVIERAREKFC